MNRRAGQTSPMVTFVVRFWREESAGEGRWRGRIEHVQSGEGAAFLDAEGMLRFMRQFGIAVGDEPVDDQGDDSSGESACASLILFHEGQVRYASKEVKHCKGRKEHHH